jgi:hypothetical protein
MAGMMRSSAPRMFAAVSFPPSTDINGLRDHAAHRDANNVGLLDTERVQQSDRILRHVVERRFEEGSNSVSSVKTTARLLPRLRAR